MIYIEFQLTGDWRFQSLAYDSLKHELRRWCSQHSVDWHACRIYHNSPEARVELRLPSTRATELFLIAWNPRDSYWRDRHRLRRD